MESIKYWIDNNKLILTIIGMIIAFIAGNCIGNYIFHTYILSH